MGSLRHLMVGAKNCVTGYSGVQPGEAVLIWTDGSPEVHDRVIEAIVVAAEEAGASVSVLEEQPPIFRLGNAPSRIALAAIRQSDVLIHVFERANAASIDNMYMLEYMFEYGGRVTAVIANTEAMLASSWATFPMELYWELFRRAMIQVVDGPFELLDANGTHLTGRLRGWGQPATARPAGVTAAGSWTFFPSGNVPLHPESPLDGVMVFDSMEGFGSLDHPVVLRVHDHRATAVESEGPASDWLRRRFEEYENAHYVCELTWGIHPKAPRRLGMHSRSPDTYLYRHQGVWHCGLGMWPGAGVPSRFHWDGGGMNATLSVAGETIIRAGRLLLLDDPSLREAAARFGDPRELLAAEDQDGS